jgi:hypothetical protein
MSTMLHRRAAATVATGALLALPAASLADPPADSLSLYQGPTTVHKDYSMNAAGGDYTPPRQESPGVTPIHTQIGPAVARPAASSPSDGFAWADAAAGAGIALLICGGVGLGGRVVVRRHRTVAGVPS